jgi:DNA-binding MarR family transcriptional regulator
MDDYAGRLLRRHGMGYSKFAFLSPLLAGPLDVTRLSQALNFSKAAVSKRVPTLEREGWIRTTEDLSVGRRVLISLTDSGRDQVAGAAEELNRRFAAILQQSAIDMDAFSAQVQTLLAAVHELRDEDW